MKWILVVLYTFCAIAMGYCAAATDGISAVLYTVATVLFGICAAMWFAMAVMDDY